MIRGAPSADVRPRLLLLLLLLLSKYPLDHGLWGATTRITQLRDALGRQVALDVASGSRSRRAGSMARYLASGRLRGLAGIYVENATSLLGPADLAFMATRWSEAARAAATANSWNMRATRILDLLGVDR